MNPLSLIYSDGSRNRIRSVWFLNKIYFEILKALWVKNNPGDIPPKTHNLKKIADEAGYPITEDEAMLFLEINDFNLETRYPDYKFDFHKKCTKEFAEEYITKIKELYKCIASQI